MNVTGCAVLVEHIYVFLLSVYFGELERRQQYQLNSVRLA